MSAENPTSQRPGRRAGATEADLRNATPQDAMNRSARVGFFVLLGFLSVVTALFLLTDPATFRGRYFLTTTLDDVGGLRKGDPVQMRGVNIGRTHRFEMQGDVVTVTLEIEGEWRIPVDSRSQLIELGVLGGKIVDIIPGTSAETIPSGGNLVGTHNEGLLAVAEAMGERADVILGRVEDMLSEPTVEAVQESAQELRSFLGQVSDLTRTQGEEVARLTASLNRAAAGLEDATGAGPDIARAAARADSMLAQLNQTSARLDGVAETLGAILDGIEAGEGTLGRLATDDSLYVNLNATLESVRLLATDLREHPGRYLNVSIF